MLNDLITIIWFILIWIAVYTIVDRICRSVDHRSDAIACINIADTLREMEEAKKNGTFNETKSRQVEKAE